MEALYNLRPLNSNMDTKTAPQLPITIPYGSRALVGEGRTS